MDSNHLRLLNNHSSRQMALRRSQQDSQVLRYSRNILGIQVSSRRLFEHSYISPKALAIPYSLKARVIHQRHSSFKLPLYHSNQLVLVCNP
jgi:hypothetical protein